MKRNRAILYSLIFLTFILLPQFGIIFKGEDEREKFQNRALQQLPEINIESLLSASYGKGLNEYIWDHLPLRTNFLQADHWIDYHIFNDSPVLDKVIIGRNDWLFFYPAVMEWPQRNSQQVEKIIALAQKATAVQKKTGKEIIIIPSPSKASIYPEFLPDYHQNAYRQNVAPFHDRLDMAAPDTKSLLLLWKPFHNEKERLLKNQQNGTSTPDRTRYLFRPRDRHFSWETSLVQTKKIIDRISPELWKENLFGRYFTVYQSQRSEMGERFMKISLPEPYLTFLEDTYMEELSITRIVYPVAMTNRFQETFSVDKNPFIEPLAKKVVVIHDSFFDQSRFLLAPYFKESIFMHWLVFKNFPVFMNAIRKADILILQSVEDRWQVRYERLERILTELEKTV